ncbi:MAG: hypothetical protein MUC99_08700 [Anaerolineae bacterium]|jgi:hypothetical protein|nr:hypothetical protein [Anaerolineae bacterium]
MTGYVAKAFVAGTPEAEVLGQVVQAFAQNLEAEVIEPILPKYGLDNIDPEKWYPHQSWMNVLRDLSETPGGSIALVAFGKKVVETAMMPPELDSIPKVLHALHTIHHLNLRNIPAEEGYRIEEVSERLYRVHLNTPNPLDAMYGFIWGLAQRFRAPGEPFTVRIVDDTHPGILEVSWGN